MLSWVLQTLNSLNTVLLTVLKVLVHIRTYYAIHETPVRFLGQEDPLEKGLATHSTILGLPCGSAGKESACNAGDPGSIPGLGRLAGEGIGYPLQYSWASLVAQLIKNLRAMRETWVQSLGWEDPLEKGKATHSSVLA